MLKTRCFVKSEAVGNQVFCAGEANCSEAVGNQVRLGCCLCNATQGHVRQLHLLFVATSAIHEQQCYSLYSWLLPVLQQHESCMHPDTV
jgi:hypothetical protein